MSLLGEWDCRETWRKKLYFSCRLRWEGGIKWIAKEWGNKITLKSSLSLKKLIIIHKESIYTFRPTSNTSTWPAFQYVSMETSRDQQYENSYYISCRKYNQNWRYCQHADIYSRRLFFGFF